MIKDARRKTQDARRKTQDAPKLLSFFAILPIFLFSLTPHIFGTCVFGPSTLSDISIGMPDEPAAKSLNLTSSPNEDRTSELCADFTSDGLLAVVSFYSSEEQPPATKSPHSQSVTSQISYAQPTLSASRRGRECCCISAKNSSSSRIHHGSSSNGIYGAAQQARLIARSFNRA